MKERPDEMHRCEVREWIRRGRGKPKEWADKLFTDLARIRGKAAGKRLQDDIKRQAALGNRGAYGDWR